jgi:VanZ family protein
MQIFIKPKKSLPYYIPAMIWLVVLLVAMLLPSNKIPSVVKGVNDKILHSGAYALAAFLFYLGQNHFFTKPKNHSLSLIIAAFILLIIGVIIEFLQENYIPGRSGSIRDILANMIGIAWGMLSAYVLGLILHKLKWLPKGS